jgi:hypothetical protein
MAGPRAHICRAIKSALAEYDRFTDAGQHDQAELVALDIANLAASLALETEKVHRYFSELRGVQP